MLTAAKIEVDDANVKELIRAFEERTRKHSEAAMYLFACRVMRRALKRVPVDTGSLRRSHFVEAPARSFDLGFVAPYARYVEHDMAAEHINGTAKFLSTSLLEEARTMERDVAADLKRLGWKGASTIPLLFPTQGVFAPTGALSRHRGAGAARRDRQARSKAERMARRAVESLREKAQRSNRRRR
jgi:hypothetical protein